jgi:hypothetical protein
MCSAETAYWSTWEILYGVLQTHTALTEFYASFRPSGFVLCWSLSFVVLTFFCGGLMD